MCTGQVPNSKPHLPLVNSPPSHVTQKDTCTGQVHTSKPHLPLVNSPPSRVTQKDACTGQVHHQQTTSSTGQQSFSCDSERCMYGMDPSLANDVLCYPLPWCNRHGWLGVKKQFPSFLHSPTVSLPTQLGKTCGLDLSPANDVLH